MRESRVMFADSSMGRCFLCHNNEAGAGQVVPVYTVGGPKR